MIISGIISILLFNVLLQEKNGMILSFFISIFAIFSLNELIFCARNQLLSFLFFILEVYCLNELLKNGKKIYFYVLLLVSFCLLCVHDTVYPLFFVIILPYLFEVILSKFVILNDDNKLQYSNFVNGKYLFILIWLTIIIGFCTPLFGTAYTNLISAIKGIGVNFIKEMQEVSIISNYQIIILVSLFFCIVGFTKTKVKIRDVLFCVGFLYMGIMNFRSLPFLYLIGIIAYTNIFTSFLKTYIGEEKINEIYLKIENSKLFVVVIFCFSMIVSINNFASHLKENYVDDLIYPVEETSYILNNLDYENIRLWTHYNFGSYLELNGIKVFIDSRAEMFIEEMNENCTILEDWYLVCRGGKSYKEIFEKYNITHVLLYNDELINLYIKDDKDYNLIYKTGTFSLYEKN